MKKINKFGILTKIFLVTVILFSCSGILGKQVWIEKEGILFSHESGHYENEFYLNLKPKKKSSKIIYTINGSIPKEGDSSTFVYKNPISVTKQFVDSTDLSHISTTRFSEKPKFDTWLPPKKNAVKGVIVRSQIIKKDGSKGKVITKTFFIDGLPTHLPEIYLTIDKNALFDHDTGIYTPGKHYVEGIKYSGNFFRRGKKWERVAHLQYLSKDDEIDLDQTIGVRIHGMASPAGPVKTLKFYSRKKYGKSKFKFAPFEYQPEITKYKKLLLRTPYSNWNKRMIADQMAQDVVRDLNIECAASIPVILYINGEFWGIHDMAEKMDESFFKNHFGVDKDSLGYAHDSYFTMLGGKPEYKELFHFARDNDLSQKLNYDSISNMMDIKNYIDFMIVESYLNNKDWPGNNDEKWRADRISPKWRWVIIDMDATFIKVKVKTLKKLLDTTEMTEKKKKETLLFRKLVENEEFKSRFVLRFEELMSTSLCPERLLSILKKYEDLYEKDIQRQMDRWTLPESMEQYKASNNETKNFIKKRHKFMIQDIKEQLGVEIHPECR